MFKDLLLNETDRFKFIVKSVFLIYPKYYLVNKTFIAVIKKIQFD